MIARTKKTNVKTNKQGYIKTFFFHNRENPQQNERHLLNEKKICLNHISGRGAIIKIYKVIIQLNSKKFS